MRNSWSLTVAALALLLLGCNGEKGRERHADVDSLNARAYAFRYVDIDSVTHNAQLAFERSANYPEGRNEARLNLAFVAYQQMDFDGVDSIVLQARNDQLSNLLSLCADVVQMKCCQRTGRGEQFFQLKSRAERRMAQLRTQEDDMSPHDVALWVYAQTEFHIIASTYYFYQEQDDEARAELNDVLPCLRLRIDTAQWVYYNYMLGPGGLVEGRNAQDITLQEFDYLFRAYNTSRRNGLRYFEANSLQALAAMYLDYEQLILDCRPDEYHLLRFQHQQNDSVSLPLAFARQALRLFKDYDDLFQTACVYRTLGEILFEQQRYDEALENYRQALHCVNIHHLRYYGDISPDTLSVFDPDHVGRSVEKEWTEDNRISTVPDWISGIRQQLSLVYSALDMKQASDYNRNRYLDLLLATNQDLELENRTEELERQTRNLYARMGLCLLLFVVALLMVLLLRLRLRRRTSTSLQQLESNSWNEFQDFQEWSQQEIERLGDEREELEERVQISLRGVDDNKRKNAENRAKVSLLHGIVPFLDRISGEVLRMKRSGSVGIERREYIVELVDQIERYNDVLTDWIKMEQGQLSLHITTFPLQRLFDIVSEGHYAFDQKQVQLTVAPTTLNVKADESLTMFMINTLCSNARKFTSAGGRVILSASEGEDYVEVSVEDTGCGLSPEDVDTLTNSKVYDASEIGKGTEGKGFGFGLMNCRGIIEKYKKTSSLFACCAFGVRSVVGQGSTFFFRIPRVVKLLTLLFSVTIQSIAAEVTMYYDSLYHANVSGDYRKALHFAQRCIDELNAQNPDRLAPIMLLDRNPEHREAAEMSWVRNGADVDYELIVGLRNEIALAALALHDLDLYRYNNRACIRLHRYIHQDRELPTYFRRLSQTHRNSNIMLVLILVASVVIVYISFRLLIGAQVVRRREITDLKQYLTRIMQLARSHPQPSDFESATGKLPAMRRQAEDYRQRILERTVRPISLLQDDISRLTDEQSRLDFERNRLHVQNQILDNCLSTIKHESMYYPSRIRLLAEKMQDSDISQLAELVQYYRQLYMLLCRQANEQVSQPGFKLQRVTAESLVCDTCDTARRLARRKLVTRVSQLEVIREVDACVVGDALLLNLLMESLLQEMLSREGAQLSLSVTEDEAFVRFTLHDRANSISDEELANLFFPDAHRIPCLVAKQILREHDTYTNHPGCRLVAQPGEDGGYEIYFTLLKA